MQTEIIIAGFGGQGVLLAGTLIAQAAIEQNLHTTWFPSYGAEMRGGTANSTIVVSNDEIGSPLAFNPNALIALNEPSLDKFMPRVVDSAVIIANSSIVSQGKEYRVKPYFVPVTDIADKEIKNMKTANLVAVGALIKAIEVRQYYVSVNEKGLTIESVLSACEKAFASKPQLIEINKKAIKVGYDFIK
ncbi:MAG: 2-oxoacid:acceptor oxidoreductase family protein [Endomicrobium sp.]|jgi:2-oxoglutarate ferredoxin oxidoreductase subunit gamma|nr:2-oxoacid:acceptor oxidoreductase family protein [Endomicrobium sp.]